MNTLEERLKIVLEKVANSFGIKQWSYIQNPIDKTIENYFSVVTPVTLVGIGKEGEVQKPVFIKFSPTDIVEDIKIVIKQHYEVEKYTYCYLLPIYKDLSNIDLDKLIPECYYANLEPKNEVIVLKDMRSEGYKGYDKRFFDKEHLRLSLEALAKFHALSIILKEKGSDFDSPIMRPYTDKHLEAYYLYIRASLQSHIGLFKGTRYEEFLKMLLSNLAAFVNSSVTEAKYLVYGHGDFWKENILFKYKNSKPIEVCVLDFQKSRKMSPAHDILTFLLSSTEVMDKSKHHEYLNIYLNALQRILSDNGLENTYSVDDLNYDMKLVAPYCTALTMMGFSLWLGLETGDLIKSKNINKENSIKFKETIINILEELNDFGYIDL